MHVYLAVCFSIQANECNEISQSQLKRDVNVGDWKAAKCIKYFLKECRRRSIVVINAERCQ